MQFQLDSQRNRGGGEGAGGRGIVVFSLGSHAAQLTVRTSASPFNWTTGNGRVEVPEQPKDCNGRAVIEYALVMRVASE